MEDKLIINMDQF